MKVICAICGVNEATTKDHIPPKNLYSKPRDNDINLNTVPACEKCNNGSSSDDEVFKVLIGITTGEYQTSPDKVIDSLAKTIGENGRIAKQIFSSKREVYSQLDGVIQRQAVAVTFDRESYNQVIRRVVRGLYWMETGIALLPEAKIRVFPGDELQIDLAKNLMELMHLLPLRKLNKNTFLYRFIFSDDGEDIWGLQFFGRHTTFVFVQNKPCVVPQSK